jgi:hypothetical protein
MDVWHAGFVQLEPKQPGFLAQGGIPQPCYRFFLHSLLGMLSDANHAHTLGS